MKQAHVHHFIIALAVFVVTVATVNLASAGTITIMSTSPLPDGKFNTPYTAYQLQYSTKGAGLTPPYAWAMTAGSLPPGMTFSSSGVVSGTPTAAGVYSFIVEVSDSGSPKLKSATKAFSLTITSTTCAFVGTNSGSISFSTIDPSTSPGPISNNTIGQQVLFSCGAAVTYSLATTPATPGLTYGSTTIPLTLGLAATGLNLTDTAQIQLLTTQSSLIKPGYENAPAGAYSSGPILVTISWNGPTPGSITASVNATGTVLNTCTLLQSPGTLSFTLDPSVSGTTSATISPDMTIQCTKSYNGVAISATSANGGATPKMNCTSPSCGTFQIPYSFKIMGSSSWPVSAPTGAGFGGSGIPMNISGSADSTVFQNAPVGNYSDTETVTVAY